MEVVISSQPISSEAIWQCDITVTKDIVVDDHNCNDRALEDGVSAEEVEEAVCCCDDAPGDDGEGDNEADELTADDVDIFGEDACYVGLERD